ncbi:SgcJ/EcaC family oxidoreductase [Rathayibacter sp. VKM Ac-2760]|nr:SgcJ/EcaC family oxidoreductase [Rathayibacter sp. VKM Ac-2760]
MSGRAVAPTDAEVRGLFDEWNAALATGDPAAVDALYTADAVLLPTVAPGVLDTSAERTAYFGAFLANRPTGVIDESVVRDLGDGFASNTGLYTFTLGATGDVVHARFTFVYEEIGGEWKIIEHHSSREPVAP